MPIFWLVDSAGARITDQVDLFPGRRGAGRIFHNQVKLSGRVPQICCLFGPSAAGGAYIPAFCDVVFMVEANASMYLGSPRMAEVVIGEVVSLEEMGGARMHATVSGCGDNLFTDDESAIEAARAWFSYLPTCWRDPPPQTEPLPPVRCSTGSAIPVEATQGYDMRRVIDGLVDEDSFFELKPDFAPELIVGLARLDGNTVGILANNPSVKGGVLFSDSADKAARFIWLCDAFNVALLYLCDVPGFMIGTEVERGGIIRHGAKMITAVSEATVPQVSVIVRKAYGAGLYAMCGPAFGPCLPWHCPAAPSRSRWAPRPPVNAVFANKIAPSTTPPSGRPTSPPSVRPTRPTWTWLRPRLRPRHRRRRASRRNSATRSSAASPSAAGKDATLPPPPRHPPGLSPPRLPMPGTASRRGWPVRPLAARQDRASYPRPQPSAPASSVDDLGGVVDSVASVASVASSTALVMVTVWISSVAESSVMV